MPSVHCTRCGVTTNWPSGSTDPGSYEFTCPTVGCGQIQTVVIAANDAAEISACPVCGKQHIAIQYFDFLKFTTSFGPADGAFVASITGPSAGSVTWRLYDGETTVEQTGLSCSYTFTTAGPHEVRLICDLDEILTLDCHSCGLTDIDGLGSCGALTNVNISGNPDLVFALQAFPISIETLECGGNPLITGSIPSLNPNAHYVNLGGSVLITGSINFFADSTVMNFWGDPLITGSIDLLNTQTTYVALVGATQITGTDIARMTHIEQIYLQDQSADQTRVNAIIDNIYAAKESFTSETIIMSIDGNNAAPSAAQILKIEELQADYGWAITYTLPS